MIQVGRSSNTVFHPSLMLVSWCLLHRECLKESNPTFSTFSKIATRVLYLAVLLPSIPSPHHSLIAYFPCFPYSPDSHTPNPKIPFPKSQMHQTLVSYLKSQTLAPPKSFPNSLNFPSIVHHFTDFPWWQRSNTSSKTVQYSLIYQHLLLPESLSTSRYGI